MKDLFYGLWPVCRKEFTHISRDPMTLFFALAIPLLQMFLLGYAVDTNVRQIPTVLMDESRTQESRTFVDKLAASDVFRITKIVDSDDALYGEMRAGKARVGVKIPYDYARRLQNSTSATVLVLVDGSDSSVAGQAVSTANGVAMELSLAQLTGAAPMPVEVRPSVLYNPATRSANFFVPGLIAVLLQMMVILMIALSIVRERERGTLEQLTMTPVAPLGLMVGKMIPYGTLAFGELCVILMVMRLVFLVPIHGNVFLLLVMALPFLLTVMGVGLLISTRAHTQAEAFQLSMGTILPSVFLSGYIFLLETMPAFFRGVSLFIPTTYFIRILRGVILRGAGFGDLWPNAAVLSLMGSVAILMAARLFVKQSRG
jgi:ABC-2 type transport system permease protein